LSSAAKAGSAIKLSTIVIFFITIFSLY
jgi:hypothetical protein